MDEKTGKIRSFLKNFEKEETSQVFEKNEKDANKLSAVAIVFSASLLLISFILNVVGIFDIPDKTMTALAIQGVIELAIPFVLYLIFRKKRAPWLKYVMVIGLLLVMMRLFSVLNHNVVLVMVIPVLLSSRYCSKAFSILISALGVVAFAAAELGTVFYGIADLNVYPAPPAGTVLVMQEKLRSTILAYGADTSQIISKTMFDSFLPRLLVYLLLCVISVLIAKHGYQMVMDQNRIAKAAAAASVELETATQIQNSMVPNIFPAFPGRSEFDVFASMNTAKEVGGDFYDFFLIDDNHLAVIMADVSGKGVPAALFMMASKILINDHTLMGGKPSEILMRVNDMICKNNNAEMFVTVWLGILEIDTGKVIAANAGHEYPVIYRSGQRFELLKDKHGFVVGGMSGIKYRDYEFTLNPNDALFLYTDGVPEACNEANELFGTERMVQSLNRTPDADTKQILSSLNEDINAFVSGAPQFDDITMLCIRYRGGSPDEAKIEKKEELS